MKSVVANRWIKIQGYDEDVIPSSPTTVELGILGIEPLLVPIGSTIEKVSNVVQASRIRKWQFNVRFMPFYVLSNEDENDLSDWQKLTELIFTKKHILFAGTNQNTASWYHTSGLFGEEIGQISTMLVEPIQESVSPNYEKGYFDATVLLREL